jgi:hypothetical protein
MRAASGSTTLLPSRLLARNRLWLARDLEIDVKGRDPGVIIVSAHRPYVKRSWPLAHCQSVVPDV